MIRQLQCSFKITGDYVEILEEFGSNHHKITHRIYMVFDEEMVGSACCVIIPLCRDSKWHRNENELFTKRMFILLKFTTDMKFL